MSWKFFFLLLLLALVVALVVLYLRFEEKMAHRDIVQDPF